MRLRTFLLATTMFTICGARCRAGADAERQGLLDRGRPDGRRAGQRQEGGLDRHHHGGDERQGRVQLPGRQDRAGQVHDHDPRGRLHARRAEERRRRRRAARRPRSSSAKARNIVPQLSNAEWMMSVPGEDQFKASFMLDCQGCHTLQRVFTALHAAEEWEQVFTRMGRYAPESTPAHPQLIVQGGARSERPRVAANMMQQAAEYLEKVSLANPDRLGIRLQDLPRPKGKATKVVITEWDLPRKEAHAARRGDRCRRARLVHRFRRPDRRRARSEDRQGRRSQDRRCCGPSSRRARSTSSSIRTAISGSGCRIRAARPRSTARPRRSRPIR